MVVALGLLVAVALLVAVPVFVAVAVPVALAVPDGDADADCDGEFVWPGPPLTLTGGGNTPGGVLAAADWLGDALLALVEGEGDGDGDGDWDGDGEGDGDGVGVPEAGSAWHTVSVLFGVVREAASALPNTPRVRKLPLSTVTAATLTCAKRIRIACLRCSSGLPLLFVIRRRLGIGWVWILISANRPRMHHLYCGSQPVPRRPRYPRLVFSRVITDLTARGPDRFRDAHHGRGSVSVAFPLPFRCLPVAHGSTGDATGRFG